MPQWWSGVVRLSLTGSLRFEDVEGGKDVEDGTVRMCRSGRRARVPILRARQFEDVEGGKDAAPRGERVEERKLIVDWELRRLTV